MSRAEIELFARTGTGVAHCPSSNMILASGIAPVVAWRQAGVAVGLGVDGSASNDGNDLLGEARQAMLLQKVAPARYLSQEPGGRDGFAGDARAMTARQALELATRGGAAVLGRDDIGFLAPGMSADFVAVNLNRIRYAGAHDPVAAMVYCQAQGVDLSVINGRIVVQDGQLTTMDKEPVRRRHHEIALAMVGGET
jgi:cytosine/adenosine deaminase-related metal-dependent hydrolase